jgi:mRNA interferase MazF
MPLPSRGEVWLADPPRGLQGRETTRRARPLLVISDDQLNRGPSQLCIVVPFTTRDRGVLLHVAVDPPEGGLTERSFLLTEQVHAPDQGRLRRYLGRVSADTMHELEDRLRIVLALDIPRI